jgi:hypothetical protein
MVKADEYGTNTVTVETLPRRRMVEGVNSSMIYLMYYKNLCKCHNVLHLAQQ